MFLTMTELWYQNHNIAHGPISSLGAGRWWYRLLLHYRGSAECSKVPCSPWICLVCFLLIFTCWKLCPFDFSHMMYEDVFVVGNFAQCLHWYLYKNGFVQGRALVASRIVSLTYAWSFWMPLSALIPCPNTGKPLLTSSSSINFHLPTALSL